MKKVILFVLAMALTSHAYCQEQPHICFKKTPVCGTTAQFFQGLMEKGYKKVAGYRAVQGDFAGCPAVVYTDTSMVSGTVWKVNATLDNRPDWNNVKKDYLLFKGYLTVKYGNPSNCYESFSGAYHEGDDCEMKAIQNKKCTYVSNWNLAAGNISISIIPRRNNAACLLITYEDSQGLKQYASEQTAIFLEDL